MKYINVILVMLAGVFHTNAQDSIRQFPNSDEKPLWVTKTIIPSCGEEVKYYYYGRRKRNTTSKIDWHDVFGIIGFTSFTGKFCNY